MAEYKTDKQTNANLSVTLSATNKAPVVAKTIWLTKADMVEYVNDTMDTATPGLLLTVISDEVEENNGVYVVRRVGDDTREGVVRKLYTESEDYDSSINQISTTIDEETGNLLITEAENSLITLDISEEGSLIVDYPSDLDYEFSISEEGSLIANKVEE